MTKFDRKLATQGARRTATGPIKSTGTATTSEGATGFSRDAKSDLFLLAVSNFVSEDTFYENDNSRDARFESLVHQVTAEDPAWMQAFIPWLRTEGLMRSASVVAAAEYVKAGGPNGRAVVASAIARADEPAEMLSYWIARHGRAIPAAVKRGVADAAQKFYSERNVLKYDGNSKSMRFADVVQLAHVRPRDDRQSALFKAVLDTRYGNAPELSALPMLRLNRELRELDKAEARKRLLSEADTLRNAGMTWEALSGYGAMDAEAWEAVIPQMGYMALLRNLRNFDQAGVSDEVAERVAAKLKDAEEVAKSRQLPFRFWSAYNNAPSLRWSYALEKALDLSCRNVPTFTGRTLIVVDTSGSMTGMGMSQRSSVTPADAAALFGAVLARKNADSARLIGFANSAFEHTVRRGDSALTIMKSFRDRNGEVGHGTNFQAGLAKWSGEDRIVIISDMQTSTYVTRTPSTATYGGGYYSRPQYGFSPAVTIPQSVPIYGFNLGGYAPAALASGNLERNEHEFGGMTDRTFAMIKLIEEAKSARWPWE